MTQTIILETVISITDKSITAADSIGSNSVRHDVNDLAIGNCEGEHIS